MRQGGIARLARVRSAEARTARRGAAAVAAEAGRARAAVDALEVRAAEGRGRASAPGVAPGARATDLLAAAAWRGRWDRASRWAEGEGRRARADAARVLERAAGARSAADRLRGRADALDRVAGRIAAAIRRTREARREREVEETWGAG